MDTTALALFGRARYKVLAGLFGLGETEAIHLRELARRTALSPTATQYELRLLLTTGLVLQEGSAGRPVYRVNRKHPVAGELQGMIRKMDGAMESGVIEDDAHWARKRRAQRADYASRKLKRKSPFLSDRALASSLSANLQKDVSYEY
jgi:hypothetical protein